MADTPDYLGNLKVDPEDRLDYGIKGMKWGVRRTPAQLAAAKSGESGTSTKKPDGPETPSQRYARISAAAKAGKSGDLDDDDLKWFNARREALSKINKLNEQKPGWLKQTTNEVIKQVAKQTISEIVQNAAKNYISDPINESVNKAADKKTKK